MCSLCVPMKSKTLQEEECGSSARRTFNIGLDISVVQHLTSDAVVRLAKDWVFDSQAR